jgi:hypothetical protein
LADVVVTRGSTSEARLPDLPRLHHYRREIARSSRRAGERIELEALPELRVVVRQASTLAAQQAPAFGPVVVWTDRVLAAMQDAIHSEEAHQGPISLTHSGAAGSAAGARFVAGTISVDLGAIVATAVVARTAEGGPAIVIRNRVRLTASAWSGDPELRLLGDLLGTLERLSTPRPEHPLGSRGSLTANWDRGGCRRDRGRL